MAAPDYLIEGLDPESRRFIESLFQDVQSKSKVLRSPPDVQKIENLEIRLMEGFQGGQISQKAYSDAMSQLDAIRAQVEFFDPDKDNLDSISAY